MPTRTTGKERIRLAAVGDLLLTVDPSGKALPRDAGSVFAGVKSIFARSDVVLGNLECALDGGVGTVSTEPRVVATPELVRSIQGKMHHVRYQNKLYTIVSNENGLELIEE